MEGETLYRNMLHRAGSEDVASKKMCLQKSLPETVLRKEPCADFVGPLPRSKQVNQMLLVLINRFSKWTGLVPLRSATTESLKKVFRGA